MTRLPSMTLSQLELFVVLVEAGGFSAAAARLGITQSARLEQALGATLFDRRESPPALTDGARRLLPHVRAMLASAESIRHEVAAEHRLRAGVLRIGSFGPASSLRLLPRLLRAFANAYPASRSRSTRTPTASSRSGWWIAASSSASSGCPRSASTPSSWRATSTWWCSPKAHPLAARAAIDAAALDGLPFIATSAGSGDDIAALLARAGATPHELFRLPQVLSVLGLVEQGLGVSVSVQLALPEKWPGVVYRPFRPTAARHVALAMLDRGALSPAAAAFVELAKADASKPARTRTP